MFSIFWAGSLVSAFAQFTFTVAGGEATVTGYTGTGGHVVIPGTLGGVPVTSIAGGAFLNSSSITSVTIPSGVISIGGSAFKDCDNLTSVAIPGSVTSIGAFAFSGCTSLSSLTIPNSLAIIQNNTFDGCSGLTDLNLGTGVTSIGEKAFFNCSGLTNLTLPNAVTTIGTSAFSGCVNLTSLTLGSGVSDIGPSAFQNCRGLTSLAIPNNVTSMGASAFLGCSGLTNLTIGSGVTNIASSTFQACTNLPSVIIPNNVRSVGTNAFFFSTSLTNLTLGTGVTNISASAFRNSSKLATVNFLQSSPPTVGAQSFSGAAPGAKGIYPAAAAANWSSAVILGLSLEVGSGDTDGDGVNDGAEAAAGTDPNLFAERPDLLAAGWNHGLYLPSAGGHALAWGINVDGRCGLNKTNTPVLLAEKALDTGGGVLTGLISAAAGGAHSLLLQSSGGVKTVLAAGANARGQLGQPLSLARSLAFRPVAGAPADVIGLAAGARHSLALVKNGVTRQVWAWGDNNAGQLGLLGVTQTAVPTQIPGLTGVVAIAAGAEHSLALTLSGDVYAWGRGNSGQLGYYTLSGTDQPRLLTNGMAQIVAGDKHTLLLGTDGKVYACGANSAGQLGLGAATVVARVPTEVPVGASIRRLVAGLDRVHAIATDGKVYAWGYNRYGELGLPATTSEPYAVLTPTEVPALRGAREISSGAHQTFAVDASGNLVALGRNEGGQLGVGNTDPVTAGPVPAREAGKSLLTVQAASFTRAFAQPNPVLTYTVVSGLVGGDTAASALNGSPSTLASPSTSPPGNYPITLGTLAPSVPDRYQVYFLPGSLTVTKASQAILFGALANQSYAPGKTVALAPEAAPGGAVVYTVESGPATISGYNLTLTGVGTVVVKANQPGNVNYQAAPEVTQSFAVTSGTATVNLTGLSQTYDGGTKAVGVTTEPAGLTTAVTYNGSADLPTGAGSYPVVVTVTDPNFTGSASGTLVIAKATPTISAAPTASAITAGQALSASTLTGGTASVAGSFGWTAPALVPSASGEYSVTFTPTDAANYTTATALVNVSVGSVNTLPTIASITDRLAGLDQAQNVGLSVSDNETATASLTVSATSSNGTLFPLGSLVAAYSGSGWSLTATPALGQFGEANITVTVTDGGGATAQTTFKITVYSAYETWARLTQGLTGADAAAGADPDGDGLVNLQEYEDGTDPKIAAEVVGYLGLLQVHQQKNGGAPGVGSLWQKIGGSNVVAERVVFARVKSTLAATAVPVQRQPNIPLVGMTNRSVVGTYDEFEESEVDLQAFADGAEAESALPNGTYLFEPKNNTGGSVGASNTVVWGTGTYPSQPPKITVDAWAGDVLRVTNVAVANAITWEAWAGTAKDQARLELRRINGTGGTAGPKFLLPATATSQTLAANALVENGLYEATLTFMQMPGRGAIRGRTTQFYLSTGPDFPVPTAGTDPAFAPATGVYGESFSLGTVAAGGTVLVTGSNLGGLTKDSFDFYDNSSGSAYFVLDPVTATANAVTIPIPGTLNAGDYQLRYRGGTAPQVLGTLTVTAVSSPFANNVNMTSTASVISVPTPSSVLGGMTLEFWIKPASGLNSGTYRVLSKNSPTGGSELTIDLNYTSSTVANLSATVTPSFGSPAVASASLPNPLAWTHVALVIFGSSVQFFIDGVAGTSNILTGTLAWGTLEMVFGNGFRGQIDDIRIYSGSRNAIQISADKTGPALAPYETSLQAYYKLDEGSGTSLADETGKNGAATGGNIAWGPGRSPGVWNLTRGDYSLQNDGTQLIMELGGTEGTTLYDQIFVRNGAATLDGIVNLMFIGAYTGPVSGSWHTFDLIWAQNGIIFGENYQLVFAQPGFTVDTSVVEKDGGQLWQATVRPAATMVDTAEAAELSRPSLGIARSPGSAGSVELMYTYMRPTGGSILTGQYTVGTMRYEVQISRDLKTWSSAVVEEVTKVPAGLGYENATVRVISESGRGFLRLKVSD